VTVDFHPPQIRRGSKSDFAGLSRVGRNPACSRGETAFCDHRCRTVSKKSKGNSSQRMEKVPTRNQSERLFIMSKWDFLESYFPDKDHVGSKKSAFGIGFYLIFCIGAPGWSLGRSRDHAGSQETQSEQGIACPNRLPEERDGGGIAHDFSFYFHSGQLLSPRRGPFSVACSSKMSEGGGL